MIEPDALFERLQGFAIETLPRRIPNPGICTGCRGYLTIGALAFAIADGSGRALCPECKETLDEYDMEGAV